MKHDAEFGPQATVLAFSALGRAVWDETYAESDTESGFATPFSALGRAVWDETSRSQPVALD